MTQSWTSEQWAEHCRRGLRFDVGMYAAEVREHFRGAAVNGGLLMCAVVHLVWLTVKR